MKPWHAIAFHTEVKAKLVDEDGGQFVVRSPLDGRVLVVVASNGLGWDHVSVSRRDRTPMWAELEHVKRIFFNPDEVAMQLHVPADDHINIHENCLHLWRPQAAAIPLPEKIMV